MPINKSAQFRFEILDECLRNTKKKWSKAELLKFVNRRLELQQGVGKSISLSQLRYDLENLEIEYAAPITMYREGKNYYYKYDDPKFSIKNIPIEQEDMSKLSDAIQFLKQIKGFSIASEMADIVHRLERKYDLEQEDQRPVVSFEHASDNAGIEHLEDIYHAIIRKNVLKITYQTYNAITSRTWHVHPYLLKEYDHRWYLLGFSEEKRSMSIYALDRMKEIKIAKLTFIDNGVLGIEEYFKDVIGVTIVPNSKPEFIELQFSAHLAPYVQSKPLHKSQTIIEMQACGDMFIRLNVCVNPELVSTLLSYGRDVKVIQPAHLVKKIHHIAYELLKHYE